MRSAIKLFRIVEDLEHFLERHALTIHRNGDLVGGPDRGLTASALRVLRYMGIELTDAMLLTSALPRVRSVPQRQKGRWAGGHDVG